MHISARVRQYAPARLRLASMLLVIALLALSIPQGLVRLVPTAEAASPDVVISQVYGGGGNAGATYKNDFIELFNRGTSPVTVNGWSVQYASTAGSTWQVTNLTGTIQPGHYYLVQEAAGTGGTTNLPTPDATGAGTGINMSATAGKVALVTNTTALSCGATNNCLPNAAIKDLVGFGTGTSSFEGTGPTATLSNTVAALRAGGGCTDSDNNATDFATGAPNPRNSASAANSCTATNNPPTITAPANPIATVNQGAAPFNVSLTGSDDGGVYNWSATPGTGVSSVVVSNGQGTATVTYTVTLQSNFTGTATFTAALSDNVNTPATTRAVNITVNPVVVANNPPTITAPANPITTVAQDSAPFNVGLTGSDDGGIYNWSATAGTGVSSVSVSGGQGSTNATFLVTLQAGFSGTATFNAALSDNVNAPVTQAVNVNVTPAPASHVVISQIYGGGGNSGATYTNDYVELFNPTGQTVDVTGWSLQYSSATGTSWTNKQPLGGAIAPGEYYLVQLASGGATGQPLPVTPNITGDINMSATTGKIALVNNGDSLTGLSPGCPLDDPNLVDFVGYGTTATCHEGTANAPAPSNTTALFRINGGNTDTNRNNLDFVAGTPNPRRTAPVVELGPWVASTDPTTDGTTVPHDDTITVNFSEPVDVDANWFNITCASSGPHNDATVAHTADFKTYLITPNVNFNFGEQCTVTILKNAIHDQDTDDSAPNTDTLFADYTWSFTVVAAGDPAPYPPSVHLTMGNPSNAVADAVGQPDNYLMMKPTYALSYNRDKGTPNWVSWHLTSEWYGSLARVDTFRADPAVPPDWYRVEGTDFSLSGFDRGHMCPNADRDNQNRVPINQETYLMSNMVPQAPDNNQGPWANLEAYLRTLTDAGSELYIVSGPAGQGGTGSNGGVTNTLANGHVIVPAYTWKVVLVLDKQDGDDVARVTPATRTIAVIMPNTQGIRTNNSNDWQTYLTSVDAVEQLTGYDFFSNVPAAIQNSIEAGVNGVNPPGTANEAFTTAEDTPTSVALSAVSPDGSNANFTYTVGQPSHGTLSGVAPNLTYTPAADYNGNDSFTFSANDGHANSNTSTVSILVTEVNDPPTATNDSKTTAEDTALTFAASDLTANDSAGPADESNQTLTVTAVSQTADTHGAVALAAGQVTYTPAADYNGPASFSYTVCDNGTTTGSPDSKCADATVNVTVTPVNDAPVASDDSATTDEDTSVQVNVLSNDTDVEGDALAVTAFTQGAHGSVTNNNGVLTYTPAHDYNGADSFTYTITDNGTTNGSPDPKTATATVHITINPVNDPPVLSNVPASATIPELSAYAFTAAATDVDSPTLTFSLVGAPAGASINPTTGQFTWTPTEAQGGTGVPYAFKVRVSDGEANTDADVTINVAEVNQPPVLAHVGDQTVLLGNTLAFTATATDADLPAQQLNYSLTGSVPAGASINPATGQFTWTPSAAQAGQVYTFGVRATDNGPGSLFAEEVIHVGVGYTWSGFLAPVNADGSSVFKLGRTIPVKFALTGASAGITNAAARLYVAKISDNVVGTEVEADSTAAATAGNLFRYSDGQYIFNMSTDGLTAGTYQLRVDTGDGVLRVVNVSLK